MLYETVVSVVGPYFNIYLNMRGPNKTIKKKNNQLLTSLVNQVLGAQRIINLSLFFIWQVFIQGKI